MLSDAVKPLVSVLMITYNQEKYIRQALESVFAQVTDFEFEVVIGEDCSTDGTRAIVKEFEARYRERMRPIYHERNVGMMRNAFEFCLEKCIGKYIALLEGDDYWSDPSKLQKQVEFLENNQDFVLGFHNADCIDENGIELNRNRLKRLHDLSGLELIRGAYIPTLTVVFRKALFRFSEHIFDAKNGDIYLYAILGQYGSAKYFSDITAKYRVHAAGVASGTDMLSQKLQALATYEALFKEPNLQKQFKLDLPLLSILRGIVFYGSLRRRFFSTCMFFNRLLWESMKRRDVSQIKLLFSETVFRIQRKRFRRLAH